MLRRVPSPCGEPSASSEIWSDHFAGMLNDADRTTALALDGADSFDPMGNGQVK
jgi:hypothetical protein